MYKITNLGQSLRVVHDTLGRQIRIQPASTVAIDLPERIADMLRRAMEKGGDLKLINYNGEQPQPAPREEQPTFPPEPGQDDGDDDDDEEVDDSQGRMHDGVEPAPVQTKPAKPRVKILKKKFKSHGVRIKREGERIQRLKSRVLDDGKPKDPAKLTASQVLAQIGKEGFTYADLLRHARRILGADSLPPRPSEHDLLQRLRRHAVASGK